MPGRRLEESNRNPGRPPVECWYMATEIVLPGVPSEPERVASPRARVLPWIVWAWAAIEAALLAGALLLFPEALSTPSTAETIGFIAFLVALALAVMAFATAGLLVTRQQPRNAVGWMMLAGGPALGAVFVGYLVGVGIQETDPGAAGWFVLLGVVLFGPALFLLGPGLASVFPHGRPLRGWWTRAFWMSAAGILLGSLIAAVVPGPVEEGISVTNPLGIRALPDGLREAANTVTDIALATSAIVAVASLIVRFRQSASEARHLRPGVRAKQHLFVDGDALDRAHFGGREAHCGRADAVGAAVDT